ncbi:hypothetical protein H634G_10781 [Metarhizium anisopliae BRIP 53293]|uniref:Endonuclease/exonuclease/phosphatase domain-containing protein n=1 Tax=Metarhizium anisopliae BRIP 53293 TaxID=1291518 RepID=A0A0D9NMT0_METAN|nr:hypothetical protein H634G_10781 [Metarhizium anisopliae BRIP 53293]
MATATPSPPYGPDPFDLGIYTPKNLARGARAALLRDSSPVEITDIGVSPARGRTAQTPSSLLTRMCNAAIAEGQQLDTTVTHEQRSPIDINDAANQLVNEQVDAYNAKLRVFRTFCAHLNEAAKEFTTEPERDFAKRFSSSFLEFWKQTLANTNCTSAPTYSSAIAAKCHRLSDSEPHRLRHPSSSGQQVLQVKTGWAIRAADKHTRDLVVERQAEWADDLGAAAVETSQRWHTYAVDNCPRRLTDLYGNELNYDAAVLNGITIVNVYRRPSYDAALDILLRWSPPERCLVAGDFNAKHYSWQTGRLADRGDDIAAWAAESGLGLLNTADVPTNPHGNTIDLAFSNIDLASAVVEDHLATSSDHFTLSLTIPNVTLAPTGTPGKVRVTSEEELQRFKELVEAGVCSLPAAATTASELDALAESLVNLLHSSTKAAGRPVRKGTRSAPWWTDECAESAAEYRAVRRISPMDFNEEVQAAKKAFQNVVRRAKRQYWRNLIDGFSDSAAVYKAVRRLKSPGAFQPPPLQIDGVVPAIVVPDAPQGRGTRTGSGAETSSVESPKRRRANTNPSSP